MEILQVLLGGLATMFVYAAIVAGVYKLFHMASDLSTIKDALLEIKRNTLDVQTLVPIPPRLEFSRSVSAMAESHTPSGNMPDPVESPR